jgi:hypothetical protein
MRKKTGPLAQLSSTKPGARWGGGFPSSGVNKGGRALSGEATKRLKAKKAKMLAAVLRTEEDILGGQIGTHGAGIKRDQSDPENS